MTRIPSTNKDLKQGASAAEASQERTRGHGQRIRKNLFLVCYRSSSSGRDWATRAGLCPAGDAAASCSLNQQPAARPSAIEGAKEQENG